MKLLALSIFVGLAALSSAAAESAVVIDGTKQTSSTCELHHLKMSKERVSLYASGVASPSHDYSRCPHARRPIDTGCTKYGNEAYGYIWVCRTRHCRSQK